MMAVQIETTPQLRAQAPVRLFEGSYFTAAGRTFDVDAKGERFLMITSRAIGSAGDEIKVVYNWWTELQRRGLVSQ